jgi:hypothetical protein
MATIKIDIDTDSSSGPHSSPSRALLTPEKIGLVSSIDLDLDLQSAFLVGADLDEIDFGKGAAGNYDAGKIKDVKKDQVDNKNCKVIAVVGGSIAFKAIWDSDQNVRWLALVGNVPDGDLRECRGGVSLDSYKLNLGRKNYLKARAPAGTYTDTNVFLYTNKNSEMHNREKQAWNSDGTFIESTVGDGAGNNNANNFQADFSTAPITTTAVGLIISDDPFFRSNRGELIKQANTWLGGDASRHIVYPSQIYATGADANGVIQTPMPGQSTLYGPNLRSAYLLFGQLARYCLDHKNARFGFFSVAPVIFAV